MTDYVQEMWRLARGGEVQGVWFFAALYALLLCGYSLAFQLRTRRWPSVRGVLLQAEVASFGAAEPVLSERDYVTDAAYRYEVAGEAYEGKRVSPWIVVASHNARRLIEMQLAWIDRGSDGTATVYYNPRKPGRSYLVLPGKVGMGVTAVIALLPAAGYLSRFHL